MKKDSPFGCPQRVKKACNQQAKLSLQVFSEEIRHFIKGDDVHIVI